MDTSIADNNVIFTYILPIVSSVGFFLSVLCFIVFSNSIFKERLYTYIKIETVFCSLYLLIQAIRPIHSCNECGLSTLLISQIYYVYFAIYMVSICEFSAFAFQIFAAINCYQLIISVKSESKMNCKMPFKLICFLTIFLSCLLFSFQLIEYEIVGIHVGNSSLPIIYSTNCTRFWSSDIRKIWEMTAIIIRDIIGMICLVTVNLILFINVNVAIKRKYCFLSSNSIKPVQFLSVANYAKSIGDVTMVKIRPGDTRLRNTKNCNIRMILMVLLTCLNCLLGRLPISFYFLLRNTNLFEEHDSVGQHFIQYCVTFISLSYSLNFALFYFSNRKFKRILGQLFRLKT